MIDLTDQVNTLPEQIKKIRAYGGGDLPEDWVGGYKLVNEKINWRNGVKVIIHLADAGAHGKEFTLSDKYPEESEKLKSELLKCCQKGIKIFGYVITDDARNSFNECQKYYRTNGGSYEICEFKIEGEYSDSDSDEIKYKKKKKKKEVIKYKKMEKESCMKEEEFDFNCLYDKDKSDDCDFKKKKHIKKKCEKKCEKKREKEESDDDEADYDMDLEDKKISSKQDKINSEFRTRVLYSVKNALP